MRLFIAADLPTDVREALRDNSSDLAEAAIPARLVAPESLHLTLAFLGDQTEDELESICLAMEQTASEVTAFEVELGDYGIFASGNQGILWQGLVDDSDASMLADCLAGHLEDSLGDAWHRPDASFAPHITLARKVDLERLCLDKLDEPWIDSGDIASITLYRSHLSSEGATYEALHTVQLLPAYAHPDGRLLLIDADACPVTHEAIVEARRAQVPVLLVGNGTQNLEKHLRKGDPRTPRQGFWAATMNVLGGADSADFQIATVVQTGDVVVTQDIGVAAMVLGAGAAAIGVRGREYTLAGIDAALLVRHEEKKIRRQGGRTAGPRAFTDEDRARFARNLAQLLARP